MKLLTVRFIKIFAVLFIFGFINATATAQQTDPTWTFIGRSGTRLNALIGSGTKLIAGHNDGIFVSVDDGQSWTASNNGLPSAITIFSLVSLNNNIFAATDKGVWKSDNDAQSWSDANAGILNNQTVQALYVYGANVFAGASRDATANNTGKVFRSANLGQMWSEVSNGIPQPFSFVTGFASIGNTIFAKIDSQLFRSGDNGNTWSQTKPPSQYLYAFSYISTSGPVIFAQGRYSDDKLQTYSATWTSSDLGDSWNLKGGGLSFTSPGSDYLYHFPINIMQ